MGTEPLPPNVFPLVVRCILHGCPECGNPVPLNGLVTRTDCPSCLSAVPVSVALWNEAFHGIETAWLVTHDELRPQAPSKDDEPGIRIEWTRAPAPLCVHCGAPLAVAPDLWRSPRFASCCGSCGRPTDLVPPPAPVHGDGPICFHVAAPEVETPSGLASVRAPAAPASGPVVMACPSCGGSLELGPESRRAAPCAYCGASVYLPDDLWRRLHPAKKALPWTAVFTVTPEALRKTIRRAGLKSLPPYLMLAAFSAGPSALALVSWHREDDLTGVAILGGVGAFFLLLLIGFALTIRSDNRPLKRLAAALDRSSSGRTTRPDPFGPPGGRS